MTLASSSSVCILTYLESGNEVDLSTFLYNSRCQSWQLINTQYSHIYPLYIHHPLFILVLFIACAWHCLYRPTLNVDMANSVGIAIVQSRLDYAKSAFIVCGIHSIDVDIHKLLRIQSLHPHHSEILHNLYWLLVHHRINFRIAPLILQNSYSINQPSYISSLSSRLKFASRSLHS
jgi:hypothetical protein